MTSMIGVWKLESFVEVEDGVEKKPFGDDPIGTLIFFEWGQGGSYMGAHLTSRPGGDASRAAPTFSFSATFENDAHHYRFTPTASNNYKHFPVGVTTGPKEYQIRSDGPRELFVESWAVAEGGKTKQITVVWSRLHEKGD